MANKRKNDASVRIGNYNFSKRGDENNLPLNDGDIEKICKYLKSPIKSGLWVLSGKWNHNTGISKYIIDEFNKKFNEDDEIHIKIRNRNIVISSGEEKEELLNSVHKLSFVFSLFTYLYNLEKSEESLKNLHYYNPQYEAIFEIIDLNKLQKEYEDAYKCFKDNIYFEGFNPRIMDEKLVRIKNGFFITNQLFSVNGKKSLVSSAGKISFSSINLSSLKKVETFFLNLGKFDECTIIPTYSPEDKIFAPYFLLLNEVYPYLVDDDNIKELLEKSIDEYTGQKYMYCVSTIGLIAEDYLTQIYETFFREVRPKKLTLGKLYDQIHENIMKEFPAEPESVPNINPLYTQVNDLLGNIGENDATDNSKKILELVRGTLHYVQEENKHIKSKIDSNEKKNTKMSIFPKHIRDNIYDLLKYRNAAAHKSRLVIGNYEALKTVYCCTTLLMWWINEKKEINWENESTDILKDSTDRNSML